MCGIGKWRPQVVAFSIVDQRIVSRFGCVCFIVLGFWRGGKNFRYFENGNRETNR